MKINKKKLEIISYQLLFVIALILKENENISRYYGIFLIIIILFYGIKILIKTGLELKIIIVFILLYNATFLYNFIDGIQISYYTEFNKFEYLYDTLLLSYIFSVCFFYKLGKIKKKILEIKIQKNTILYILFFLFFILFFINGIDGKIGDYREIKLKSFTEYSILFYFLAFLYSGNSKILKKMLSLCALIFSIYSIMIGSRIVSVQLLMSIFFCNGFTTIRNIKLKSLKISGNIYLIYIYLGIIIMKSIGIIRSKKISINNTLNSIFKSSVIDNKIMNNQSDVIYSTMSLIALEKIGVISKIIKLKSLLFHIKGFLIYGNNNIYANFPKFVVENSTKYGGGGGFFFGPIYIWAGYIGVILIAYFLGEMILKAYDTNSSILKKFYVLVLLSTFFRWYAYSIYGIYKIPIYGIILYLISEKINFIMKGKVNNDI